ncbi:MAG: GDSL-type esterase/lipase family protein [Parafilimonas sp.]
MQKIYLIIFVNIFFLTAYSQTTKVFFTSKEITRVDVNANYEYHFNAKDSDNNPVSYSLNNLPQWLSWNADAQGISGKTKKAGQYPVDIIAYTKTDTVHQHFMLTVYDKQTTNILCLGNSITNGVDTFNSYRRDLWQMLHTANYNFDFIGSWSNHAGGTTAPEPDFDMDHEGHSGWTFEHILKPPSWDSARGNLHQWINDYTPDIVLIELGTNDVFQCRKPADMFANLNVILALLREKNKHVKIFLAQIPPLGAQWSDKKLCGNDTTYHDAIVNLNKDFISFTREHTTAQSPIILVDQYTGVNPATDTFDDIHPNTKGEKIMAERWFEAVKWYLKKLK